MRVYLAGPYAARDQLQTHVLDLLAAGLSCTSSWLAETHEINAGTIGAATALPGAQVSDHAKQDLLDIDHSDAVVLFTAGAVGLGAALGGTGGRHVETGYAIAREKPVIVVGEPENVFHRYEAAVTVVGYWPAALALLVARHEAPRRLCDDRACLDGEHRSCRGCDCWCHGATGVRSWQL